MLTQLKRFAADQSGVTGIEYALIAMLVSIAIIASVTALGSSLNSIFDMVTSEVNSATS
jgi:pilus assembly protein Flp/PilA